MLEILHFVFSSFWVWLGTLLLLSAAGASVVAVIAAVRGK